MKASLERPSCCGKCREYGADHSDVTRRVGRVEIRYWPGPTLVARWLAAVAMIGISARPRPISNQHVKPVVRLAIPLILSAFSLGACVQTPRDPLADANLQPRDRALLANAPYAHVTLPVAYQRTVVEFHRKEAAGSIVIDTDARYLYYVLGDNKAVRYGVAVGEQALSWYGVAKIGRKAEWPSWTPTEEIKRRRGNIPDFVEGGGAQPYGRLSSVSLSGRQGYSVSHSWDQSA